MCVKESESACERGRERGVERHAHSAPPSPPQHIRLSFLPHSLHSVHTFPWLHPFLSPPPPPHPGGETAALARLKYFLWDTDLIATYFDTRNGMLGGDYSTKFAPWLAAGCLSPRMVYHEVCVCV